MARDSDGGGGGALGWTLLGFLAGVAATLSLQILMSNERPTQAMPVSVAPPVPAVAAASGAQPKPAKKAAALAASSAAPVAVAPRPVQPADEVADDAAAAGMTSRTTPANERAADDRPSTTSN